MGGLATFDDWVLSCSFSEAVEMAWRMLSCKASTKEDAASLTVLVATCQTPDVCGLLSMCDRRQNFL
jgi:hypothetical protein